LAEYNYYHIYPDPEQGELRAALSSYVGVPAANILASHGADELLDYLSRLFLRPGDAIIDCPPTFGMYSFDAELSGGTVLTAWRRADYSIDVDAVETLVADSNQTAAKGPPVKLLYLTSPNNPTGNWLDDDELRRLLALPVMVVLDEAYVEFADHPSRAGWVLQHDNLVVLRTFSKAAGIAGLRLGYGICPDWLMEQLWKFKQPYNVNVAAAVAGLASLAARDQLMAVVAKIKQERARLFDGLAAVPYLHPYPSQANFILCDVLGREGKAVKADLERQGILVRHYAKPRLENCIRISVGRPEQTDRLLAAL
jgi:histidinol-phosphate aminotransferase